MSPYYSVVRRNDENIIVAARISNFKKGVSYDKVIRIFEICPYFEGVQVAYLPKGVFLGEYRCIRYNNHYRLFRMTCGDVHIVSTTLRRLVDCQICSLIDYCKINQIQALHQIEQ